MGKIAVSVVFLLLFANNLFAEQISLKDGKIIFKTPHGFKEMTRDQILTYFARANPPAKAYANGDFGVTISIIFSPALLQISQLEGLKSAFEQSLPRSIPNLEWIEKEIVTNNEIKWVHFEFTGSSISGEMHSNMFFTSFDGKMLGFNFNSTEKQYGDYLKALQNSFKSIKIY